MQEFLNMFSKREKEVVYLIAKGMTNKEIAARLYLTVGTVKSYVHKILTKAGLTDRREIIIILNKSGEILSKDR